MHPEEQSPSDYKTKIFALTECMQNPDSAETTILRMAKEQKFRAEWLQKPKKVKKRNLGTSVDPTLWQMLYCRLSYKLDCL